MKIITQKPMRLDLFLKEALDQPRNQIEQLIKTHAIMINGKIITKSGFKLKGGETLEVTFPAPQSSDAKNIDFDVEILYEDDALMVINKPPHLVVHPAPSVKEPTLVDWLKHKGISLSTLSGEERHGIVHRIDKETSGALIIAKDNETHAALSRQLEDKSMGRIYLALIDMPLREDIIVNKPIDRDPKTRTKMAISKTGREAKSAFIKLQTAKNSPVELIGAKLFTGRTHQIRVHLESLSRHILNDFTYGFKSKKDKLDRVMLHAYLIYFIHPKSGQLTMVEAPMFSDFRLILEQLFDMEAVNAHIHHDTLHRYFDTRF